MQSVVNLNPLYEHSAWRGHCPMTDDGGPTARSFGLGRGATVGR